jgi:1-hydroxycarotenoid 3,4-desaturase
MQRKNISKTRQDGNKLREHAKIRRSNNSENFRKPKSGRGRINLRAEPKEAVFNLPKTLSKNKSKGALFNGRRSSSGTRFANGSPIRQACGRNDKTGPCFDLNIPSNGYDVWSFASETKGLNLAHHNVFFNDDYKSEFDSILAGRIAKDPTLYVCQQEEGLKSRSKNRFEIIINAPSLSQNKISVTQEYNLCKERTFQKLGKMGINFKNMPKFDDLTTPRIFENLAPGADGSIYGLSPQRLFSTFQRPSAKTKVKGLYLTGGGVHPGPGLPMAALSGKHAAEMIKQDLALT